MRQIVHDWPDDLAIAILKNVKGSMKSESRLLIRANPILLDTALPLLIVILSDEYVLYGSNQRDPSGSPDMIVVRPCYFLPLGMVFNPLILIAGARTATLELWRRQYPSYVNISNLEIG